MAALRREFEHVFQRAGMAPGEEAVEVADGFVGAVVGFRADDHDAELAPDQSLGFFGQAGYLRIVLDRLGIPDSGLRKRIRRRGVLHKHTCHDQRPEKIALPALVDPGMRVLEFQQGRRLRLVRRESDHRLQHEFHEILRPGALDNELAGPVGGDLRLFAGGFEQHIRPGRELPRGNAFEICPERVHLGGGQGRDETGFSTHGGGILPEKR